MIECVHCGKELRIPPKYPITVEVGDDGKQFIPADYTETYEHMRDEHPEAWNAELAQEFEDWKAGLV